MSLQICQQHGHLKDYICARNDDNQMLCRQCFLQHSESSGHAQSVRLCLESKEFFLKWTEYVLKKMMEFKQIVSQMGYSKVFDMKLQPNHPKGSVNELNFQDIEQVAMEALQQHRLTSQGNLTYIQGTSSLLEMLLPEFLKDLYNIVCEDTKFNLSGMLSEITKKLVSNYPDKQIYKFASFSIVEKQLQSMEEKRRSLLAEYEGKVVLLGRGAEVLKNITDKETEKDYMSPAHHSSIQLNQQSNNNPNQQTQNTQQQPSSPTNISTVSNPSMTVNETKQLDYSHHNITDTISETNKQQKIKQTYEQLTTTIAFLKENEMMYQQKVTKLEQQNAFLKMEVQRLKGLEGRVKELEDKLNNQNLETIQQQQKVSLQLSAQLQAKLNQQINELTLAQASLIQENAKINHALKDMQDIAEGRSRTIVDLQQQIKTLTQNIQLKQKSIQQLNMLISNEQEQISYRQNQVEILGEQIKKKLQRISFLQKSIQQHTKLVSNEEEQITYRQKQVETLNQQISKLKSRNEELQKSIKSLNSLIFNQEQQLSYRENQADILQAEITKLLNRVKQLQNSILEWNQLIGSQQEEIKDKQNEVQNVNKKVKKLVQTNKNLILQVQQLKTTITELLQQNSSQQQSEQKDQKIKLLQTQLNLINQQNMQLTDQVKIFKEKHLLIQGQLRAEVEKSTQFQVQLKALKHNYALLETEVGLLKAELLNVRAEFTLSQQELQSLKERPQHQDFNAQLATQVIELQSQLLHKQNDFKILSQIAQDCSKYLSKQEIASINSKLSTSLLTEFKLE